MHKNLDLNAKSHVRGNNYSWKKKRKQWIDFHEKIYMQRCFYKFILFAFEKKPLT